MWVLDLPVGKEYFIWASFFLYSEDEHNHKVILQTKYSFC